jgi:hypothetical protein
MGYYGIKQRKCILKGHVTFTVNAQRSVQLFAAVTHLVERPSLETLLKLKLEKSLICLVGTRRPRVSIIEQQSILFLKTLIRNKVSRFWRLESSALKCK